MESAPLEEPAPSSSDQPQFGPAELTVSAPDEDIEADIPSPAPSSPTQDLRPRPENTPKDDLRAGASSSAEKTQAAAREQAEESKRREAAQKKEQWTPPPPPPAFDAEIVEEVVVEEEMADELEVDEPEIVGAQRTPPPTPSPSVASPAPASPTSTTDRARVKLKDALPQALDDAVAGSTQPGSPAGAYLNGRITNENGYPILNALVRLPGLPLGERTDSNGIFQLPADAVTTVLDISHPDYESERVNLTDFDEEIQISLERKEFVPEDNRPRWQQNATSARIIFDNKPGYASPLEGYNALRKRIEANKPADVPTGKVKLDFLVNPDGTLTDIRFRAKPSQATMDYIGQTLVTTSVWEVVQGDEPVRVYFKVVFK
jgi:hypothetical protein